MRGVSSWVRGMGVFTAGVRELETAMRRVEGGLSAWLQAPLARITESPVLRSSTFDRFGAQPWVTGRTVCGATRSPITPVAIRAIDMGNSAELDAVSRNTLKSHHETIPETHGREDLPNMAFESMRDMLEAAFSNPDRHCLVAVNGKGEVIGHRILKIKIDEEGRRFGEGWSLYIDPAYRNQGIASHLMRDADAWFCAQNVAYLETGTHVNNVKMQNLYAKQGYRFDRYGHNGVNPVYIVRKYL